jgi:CubicO group peptidase (beta-lactamase class C family)
MSTSLSRRQAMATLAAAALPFRSAAAQRGAFGAAVDRARGFDQLHSLVIAREGEVVVSEAVRGPAPDRPVNVKSVSKTIVAALTGIAIARGLVDGPEQPLAALMPRRIPADADPLVRAITVDHLLTMRAGLERTSGRNYGGWVQSRNWVADALRRPFVAEPGGPFLYSTGSFHLLGAALAEASGKSLLTLSRQWLGEPLGIAIPPWTRDPQGFYMGGNNMALSPLGLIRFGEAFRLAGRPSDPGVIPPGWVEASWTPRTRSPFSGHDYGYGWFLAEAQGHRVAYARGYGGQMLYVVPSLALTVAITSDPTRPARSQGYAGDLNALLAETIIPATG